MEAQYPILFECCRLIKGATRTLLCDIQRNSYRFIPNELFDLLELSVGKTVEEIKLHYNHEYDEIIDENLAILHQEEFIFFTENPEMFPQLNLNWERPNAITNGIVDIDPDLLFDFNSIWEQFADLGCEHLQIRVFKEIGLNDLEEILFKIQSKRIISLELVIPFSSKYSNQDYIDFVYRYARIFTLTLHSAKSNETIFKSPTRMGHIFCVQSKIDNVSHCGQISEDFFIINMESYIEFQKFNSCLNRKISIDVEGNIKNCPSMSESFGNIKDTTLVEALEKPGFKKYWDINKDKIHVCKDCEFRYICTDCRAYTDNPEDILSKPLKCGYNPYTGEWSEWSSNSIKQKAINFYGL